MLSVFHSRDFSRAVHGIFIDVRGTPSMIYTDSSTSAALLESVTIVYPNLLCMFILFLGDRRAKFLFSTTFPNSSIMSGSISRCRLRSRSHVDVRVMFLLCFPRVSLQFSSLMPWCHFLQGSENRSALAVDDLLTVPWATS